MRIEYPYVLWLLLAVIPILSGFYWWSWRKRQALMTQFIQARLLPGLTSGLSPTRQKIRFACIIAAVTLLIVTLARPQWGYHYEEVKQRGLDIVVAIDTSKSMLAEDITPNRLQRAKLAALDLMQQAKSDRLGLVAFAGGAFLQCPLTIDDTAFRQSVEALDVNIIPQGGTAIAEAIHTALSAFKEQDNYKVLVLFTDGEDNDEGAMATAQAAAKEGLRIFTIGIGTAEGELLRITDNKGRADYIRDEQGNVVKSHLNESLLQQIAGATEGGFYLPLRGAKTIDTLYEKGLAPLPKSEQTARLVRQYHEQFHWTLAFAIALLFIEMLLPERKRRAATVRGSNPSQTEPSKFRASNKPAVAATAVVALLVSCGVASGSTSSAFRDYKSGNFNGALQEYQRLQRQNTNDARLNFNTGATAYRKNKYDEAMKQFGHAISAQDLTIQQQAYYNLGDVLYRIGEKMPDPPPVRVPAKTEGSPFIASGAPPAQSFAVPATIPPKQTKPPAETAIDVTSPPKGKIDAWEKALQCFDNAIKLNTNDFDAKFNYEFVKRKLDELKKQQEEEQDQQGGGQDQQKQDQGKNDEQQQQKQDSEQKQDQKQQSEQEQKEQQDKQQAENESKQQKEQENKQQEQGKSGEDKQQEKPDEQQGQQGQANMQPMTPEEAQKLLDAQKGDEQLLQFKPEERQRSNDRPIKDW